MATSGKYLAVTIGGVISLNGQQEWSASDQSDRLDDTTADANGYSRSSVGVTGVRITVRGIWDTVNGVMPDIRPGVGVTDLRAFGNRNQVVPDYYLPLCTVLGPAKTTRIRGQIEYSFDVENYGIYYIDGRAAAV